MKKYILPIALTMALGFTACNDDLDITPYDRESEENYFTTEDDLKLFTNPLYNNLLPKYGYDETSDLIVVQNLDAELRGGQYRSVPKGGTKANGWYWVDLRRINSLLDRIDRCPDKDAVVKYTAVARFFRAYLYMDKVVRFGDVPWYDYEIGSADKALYKDRDSRELIMTNMLEDVKYAIENLPNEKTQDDVPYRVTKWAALALKAQFCLFEGTYRKYHGLELEGHDWRFYLEESAAAAKELIETGPYKIWSSNKPASDYRDLFRAENANANEYILAIRYDGKSQTYHDAYGFSFTSARGMPGYTRKMVNMYLMADGSKFTDKPGWETMTYAEEIVNRDPRLTQSIRTPGLKFGSKTYSPNPSESVTGYNPIKFVPDGVERNDYCTNDMPVFRLAEVMLNYAEAKAELGTLSQDDLNMTVNEIRKRVNMPKLYMSEANANPDAYLSSAEYGYPNVTGANKGVILEIRRERAVELIQEGFRWADIRRWKAGKCFDQALTGMYFPGPGEYDLDGDGTTDIILVKEGDSKPEVKNVQIYEIGQEIKLTNGDKGGYINYHGNVERIPFNEDRDYLYPIPSDEIELVRAAGYTLTQNPSWI